MSQLRAPSIPDVLYGRSDIASLQQKVKNGDMHKHKLSPETVNNRQVVVLKCKACITKLIEMDPQIVTPLQGDPNATFSTHWTPTARLVPKTEEEILKEQEEQRSFAMQSGQNYADFLEFQRQRGRNGRAINF